MRTIKKVFAAAVLGTVGFSAGICGSYPVWGHEYLNALDSQCGQDWIKNVSNANDILQKDPKNPVAADNLKKAFFSKDFPCSEIILNDAISIAELSLGLAAAGVIGGAFAFGRKPKPV